MKHRCIAVLLCVTLIIPAPAGAATNDSAYRDALLRLVLLLQQQIAALTAERDAQMRVVTGSVNSMNEDTPDANVRGINVRRLRTIDPDDIYESEFYDGRYVAIYKIRDTELIRTHGYADELHERIFSALLNVAGRSFVSEYIAEFRVYYDEDAAIDAFIDQIGTSNRWVIGVNRYSIEAYDRDIRGFLRELFVHEIAHILIHNEPEVRDTFSERFWDAADRRHARRVERSNDPYAVVNAYVEDNPTDFVTEYAATSLLEDMAETFTYYVLADDDGLTGEALEKVRFLAREPAFAAAKRDILNRSGQ